MIVVIMTVIPEKRLSVLLIVLINTVIVKVYFNTMACKKVSILNYSETITCFTVFRCCKIKGNWYCRREINLEYCIMLNRVITIHVNCFHVANVKATSNFLFDRFRMPLWFRLSVSSLWYRTNASLFISWKL